MNCIFRMNAYYEFLLFRTLKEWCLLGTSCEWTHYPWSCLLMLWTTGAKDNSKPCSFDMRCVWVCKIPPKLKQYLNTSLITVLFLFFRDILVRLVHFWNYQTHFDLLINLSSCLLPKDVFMQTDQSCLQNIRHALNYKAQVIYHIPKIL